MLIENELIQILDLLAKIMTNLNKIPWEKQTRTCPFHPYTCPITLSIFKYLCKLLLFEMELFSILRPDDIHSKNYKNMLIEVFSISFRFFTRGQRHFKKFNFRIVDAYINAEKSESPFVTFKEKMFLLVVKRIKNCDTIQDLIYASPTKECPVCMEVTFTESTPFNFRLNCNHLVCDSCRQMLKKSNNTLVKINIIFLSFD